MEYLTIEQQLFEQQQKGENTDCSFVFKIKSEDEKLDEKVIHGHKIIISAASKYFETNLKPEWNGNMPIAINSFEWRIFDKLIRAIYLSEVTFETLQEAMDIYEAAHFYQMERVLELLRNAIQGWCLDKKILKISSLAKIAWKFQDYKLIPFVSKYFCANTHQIIATKDFMEFSPEVINWLFQYEDLSVNEIYLVISLEKYLETNKNVLISMIKPAVDTIRFLALNDVEFAKTTLLTRTEKDFLMKKTKVNLTNLSKNRSARTVKTFFSQLPDNIKIELVEKLSWDKCWVCKDFHSVVSCSYVSRNFKVYRTVEKYMISPNLIELNSYNLIEILKCFQKESREKSEFSVFSNIDYILRK